MTSKYCFNVSVLKEDSFYGSSVVFLRKYIEYICVWISIVHKKSYGYEDFYDNYTFFKKSSDKLRLELLAFHCLYTFK